MSEDKETKKTTRSPRIPGAGRRPTITFRCRPDLQSLLQGDADKNDRSLSEEIERRLERSFEAPVIAEAAAKAVVEVTEALAFARTRSTQTVFATLEEYEKYCGGKDACSFGYHVGKQLALCIKNEDLQQDLLGRPLDPPEEAVNPGGTPWFESDARRDHIRAKVLKSASGLFDIWTFIQTSSPIPAVGWRINQRVETRIASGEFDRKPDEDPPGWRIVGNEEQD